MSDSQQVSKDIVQEEFYVLEEPEAIIAPITTKISIVEPEKEKKDDQESTIDLADEDSPGEIQEEESQVKKKEQEAEDLDTDFFEKGVDEDAEKKKVVEEITGMTDVAETASEVAVTASADDEAVTETAAAESEPTEEESKPVEQTKGIEHASHSRRASVVMQFRPGEKPDGISEEAVELDKDSVPPGPRKSVEPKQLSARRASGIPELMKLSKRSLLALTASAEGSVAARPSFRKDGPDLSGLTGSDYATSRVAMKAVERSSRRSTFYAELGPRYKQTDDEDLLADFEFGGDTTFLFDVEQEEEKDIEIQEEEEPFKLIRTPFYERHDKAAEEIVVRKIRNFILHKKLSMYFKRKKMDYVTKETDWSFDGQNKYHKKLEAYGDLRNFIEIERARVSQELDDTKVAREEKFKKLTHMFKKMQDREGEIGYGLINTKTGNALPDKFVERLLRRQHTQMSQVSAMRLTFIRLKGMVQEKLDTITSLNEIAPGFLLVDYEQLKSDNRAYADKIEEKDEELTRLRAKCSSTIQVLAHLREKTSELDNDVEDLEVERRSLELSYFIVRSRLNEQKQNRDVIRHALNKMRDESGLLTQPTLLKDMEQGLIEVKSLTDHVDQIMKDCKKKAKQITNIRKKIEQTVDLKRGASRKSLIRLFSPSKRFGMKKVNIYRGRPTLLMPHIEDSAFDSLKAIKPKLTYDRSHRNHLPIKHQNKKSSG